MTEKRFVLYLNVGNLPHIKAEEHVKKVTSLFNEGENPWLKTGEKLLVVAVRDENTRLEAHEG